MQDLVNLFDKYNIVAGGFGLFCLFLFAIIYRLRRRNAVNSKALDTLRQEMLELNVGMLKINTSGTLLFANQKAERLLGRKSSSLVGMCFSECFIETDKSIVKDAIHNSAHDLTACANSSRLFLQVEFGALNVDSGSRDVFIHDINELLRSLEIENQKYNTLSNTLNHLHQGRIQLDFNTGHMVLDDRAKQILSSNPVRFHEMSSRQTVEALKSRIHKEDELKWNQFLKQFEQEGRVTSVFRFTPLDQRIDNDDLHFDAIRVAMCSPSGRSASDGFTRAEALITKDSSIAPLIDAAQHAEVKLKAIVSTSTNPMYVVDRNGKLLDYNSSFNTLIRMIGISLDENDFFSSGILPDSIVALHQPVTGVVSHSKQAQFEITDSRKNVIHLRLTLTFAHLNSYLDEKQNLQVVGSIQNVTEKLRADKELAEERSQLAKIYDLAPLAIAKINADSRIIMANHLFTHIMRYTESECRDLHLWDLAVNRDDASSIATNLKHSGKVREFSTMLRGKDETLHACELNIDLINKDKQEYLIWIFDRTAEQFEQDKFETLLDNCNMPMAILGQDGFTSVNASAIEFFGQKEAQSLLAKMPYDLALNHDEQKADEIKREIDHVLLNGKVNSFSWSFGVDGVKLPCHCTFIPVFKDQEFESILCLFIDQREILRADEERIQALALQQQAMAEQRLALKEVEETQAKLNFNKEQLATYEEELSSVQEQYNKTREEAEAKQRQLQESKNQLADTESQLSKVHEQYLETREEADAARRQLHDSKDQLDNTKQQLASVQAQFDQTRQQAAVTQEQLSASNDKLANTVEQLASVQAQFDETRQEYSDLKQSHENVAENLKVLQSQYSQSRELLAAAEQSNQDLSSQLEQADQQVQGLNEQREEIIRALHDSEANYHKAQKALVASQANVEQLENHLGEEKARQSALEHEITQMQKAVSTKDQQINAVNEKIDQLNGQLSHSKDASALLKTQLDSQRQAREAAEREQEALAKSYQSARSELSNKERNLQHMQDELAKLETMSRQERSDMQAQQATLKQELQAKQEQLQHTAGELERARIAAEHEKRASKAQKQLVVNLQNELHSAEQNIAEKQAQMDKKEQALKQTQESLVAELADKQQKLQDAEHALQNTKEQNEAERDKHKQAIASLKLDLSQIEARSAEQSQIIRQSDEQWQRDKELLAQEIHSRRQQLASTQEELATIQQQADKERHVRMEQENKLEQLRGELTDVESRAEKQNQMMAGNEEQWLRHHEEIEQQKQRLQESLQQANVQNQALQKQLEGKLEALNRAELQVNESKSGEQELVTELETARSQAESLQQRIEEQANHEKALQQQLVQQQGALQSKESTIADLQSSQDALAAELARVQQEYAQSKQTLSEQQNSHDGLNSQMSELEQALAHSQKALRDKEEALSEVQKALETSQSKLEEQETELVQAHKKELEEYSRNTESTAVRIPDIEAMEMPDNPSDWFDLLPYLQKKGEIDSLPKALSELIESLQARLIETEQAIVKNDVTAIFQGIRGIIAIANEVNSEVLTDIMTAIEFDCKCGLFDNVSIRWPVAKQSLQQTLRVIYSHLHA